MKHPEASTSFPSLPSLLAIRKKSIEGGWSATGNLRAEYYPQVPDGWSFTRNESSSGTLPKTPHCGKAGCDCNGSDSEAKELKTIHLREFSKIDVTASSRISRVVVDDDELANGIATTIPQCVVLKFSPHRLKGVGPDRRR